jgi:hypothetical protein
MIDTSFAPTRGLLKNGGWVVGLGLRGVVGLVFVG